MFLPLSDQELSYFYKQLGGKSTMSLPLLTCTIYVLPNLSAWLKSISQRTLNLKKKHWCNRRTYLSDWILTWTLNNCTQMLWYFVEHFRLHKIRILKELDDQHIWRQNEIDFLLLNIFLKMFFKSVFNGPFGCVYLFKI